MYSATYDWGATGNDKFQVKQLDEMKKERQTHCFSTLNHNLAYCHDSARAIKWILRQAGRAFQGVSASLED